MRSGLAMKLPVWGLINQKPAQCPAQHKTLPGLQCGF